MLEMYVESSREDAEVEETRDILVTLKARMLRDLQNAGAFLAERRLFPSSLHRHRPFSTQVNHRCAHTVNTLPERSTRDLSIRCDVDQYADDKRSSRTSCEAKTRFCRARRRQQYLIMPHDQSLCTYNLSNLAGYGLRRLK